MVSPTTRRANLALSCLFAFLTPQVGHAAGVSFSGTLERVSAGSLSIRLTDRRIIDAGLPDTAPLNSEAILRQYRMGDQVEVTCERTQPVWEKDTARYQTLEVSAIRLVRRPEAEELAKILAGVPFREGRNLLHRPAVPAPPPSQAPDSAQPGGKELEHARGINLAYAANMPNFVADEKARRYRRGPGSTSFRDFDTVESEITF